MVNNAFRRRDRIRTRKAYITIYSEGTRRYSRNFTIITNVNQVGHPRIGIAVSKKVGNAVRRNRIKRLIREFFRLHKAGLPQFQDTVIISKQHRPHLRYRDVNDELLCLLTEAGK